MQRSCCLLLSFYCNSIFKVVPIQANPSQLSQIQIAISFKVSCPFSRFLSKALWIESKAEQLVLQLANVKT
jgi:hypothetical protein